MRREFIHGRRGELPHEELDVEQHLPLDFDCTYTPLLVCDAFIYDGDGGDDDDAEDEDGDGYDDYDDDDGYR